MTEVRSVYLDNAATTPVRREVVEEMIPYMTEVYGNPNSVHAFGREARKAIEEARERVAKCINAQPGEIIFTGGGTESDNIAVRGVVEYLKEKGKHIITSKVEHHAILETYEDLEKRGYDVTFLPVDQYGLISLDDLKAAIRPDTILVSIMYANNEIGTIQPITEIGAICREHGIIFHTDAVQAMGHVPIDVKAQNIDMLSFTAHKFYGPKGVGALYMRRGVRIKAVMTGGGQERKLRPGTENVPGIMGLAKALELAVAEMPDESARISQMRDELIAGLTAIPNVRLNGHPTSRLPNNVNISVRYCEGESMILNLDMKGVGVSSGSACSSGSLEPSHVLMALGLSHEDAHGSLRLTLGRENTEEDVKYVLAIMPEIINRIRAMSAAIFDQKVERKLVR
jgi:cysteine desulfurase